ncbi:ATPase family protein, partial [Dictyocaulus viviparus]
EGIDKVVFGTKSETISAIVSAHGEHVPLSRPVWLQDLSDEMRSTLKKLSLEAIRDAHLDPARFPSQVLCLAEQVRFCRDCEQELDGSKDLSKLRTTLQEQLKVYTNTKVNDIVLDLKLKALILDIIHHIDVIQQLIDNKASSSQCWTWQRQLRFYLIGDAVVVRQVNSEFHYTYEYQGNTQKLVHTPLTDKCYLTLTQAMHMGLGGNPYGPAGTGKTESVKALASLFGRQVLVFNCDEGIDVLSMSRIFIGIVECGAWGCFDEFNRLDQTVLSAVSMQIQTIQDVIKSKSGKCVLGGKAATVNPNAAIFITLNPAGKGYGGRQRMPDNLKQLFRPVVMSVPDNDVIAETILYSEGFMDAKNLARKIVTIFKLSKEMLSPQQHYDWGLRALKVVLRGCGDLRTTNPDANETEIVVQALLLNTLSKLTSSDSKRFNVLIDDVFSTSKKEMATFGDLIEPLNTASNEMNIKLTEKQSSSTTNRMHNSTFKLQKVFQLYEQLRQRIGVVIVGPSGAGKSTIWRVLKKAQLAAGLSLRTVSFNPKAMNRTKLLGQMDIDTREWTDGILTMAAREVVKDTSVHTWIIFDGDVDPEWIEALNSVLDDNRLLTMPSGERIHFDDNVNFLFETDSLQFASPATVSRMGMIFVSEEDISAKEVVKQWSKSLSDEHPDLLDWIEQHFYRCYDWCLQAGLVNGIGRIAAAHNGLSHLRRSRSREQFLVGLYRGLSSVIDPEKKREFASSVVFHGIILPDDENPDLVYCDSRSNSLMRYQDDLGMGIKLDELKTETKPFILTASAQSNKDTVLSLLSEENRQPFLVVGPDGCGKEELLRNCFKEDNQSQLAIVHSSAHSGDLRPINTAIPPLLIDRPMTKAKVICHAITDEPGPLGSSIRVESMASVMVRLYEEVRSNFQPTNKVHYIFTPRDLTKWTLATLRYELSDEVKVIEAITSESKRIFRDRLATEEHVRKFDDILAYVIPSAKARGDQIFVTNGSVISSSHNVHGLPLFPYSKHDYQSVLQKAVNRYEFEVANFNNVITEEMCELCAKVDRALTAPGGSVLLAGRPGLGRANAIRLIANIHQMQVLTPKMTPNYGQKQFDLDLKNVCL